MTPDSIYLPDLLASGPESGPPQASGAAEQPASEVIQAQQEQPGIPPSLAEVPPWADEIDASPLPPSSEIEQPAIGPSEAPSWGQSSVSIAAQPNSAKTTLGSSVELERRMVRNSWLLLLTTGYASAVTLALCWLIFTGRVHWVSRNGRSHSNEASGPDGKPSLATAEPIANHRRVRLGKVLRLADIEIQPLEIKIEPVWLRNTTALEPDFRKGDIDCLWLRLQVRNRSKTDSFIPLESEFLRQDDSGSVDSFIETGGDPIPGFPLPRSSEWAINGEEFPTLAPGEERELVVVSAGSATRKLTDHMTWRLRLRVAKDRTELVGIEFDKADVR